MTEQPHESSTADSDSPPIPDQIVEAPTSFMGIVRRLGPGLIIAGSIVGSGELIATTKTGAQAGISLLWLILIGCLIKVFVQVELGRYTISQGETTLSALDQVPGPRWRANWIVWFWILTVFATIGQLGGIVGGVGQSLALSFPLLGDYKDTIKIPAKDATARYIKWDDAYLTEWNVQLYDDWHQSVDQARQEWELPNSPFQFAHSALSQAEAVWVQSQVKQVAEKLQKSAPGGSVETLSNYRTLRESESNLEKLILASSDVESLDQARTAAKAARESFEQILDSYNQKRVGDIIDGSVEMAAGDELKSLNQPQRGRLSRGQMLISKRFAELDREPKRNRSDTSNSATGHRSVEAVVAVHSLLLAQEKAQNAKKMLKESPDDVDLKTTYESLKDERDATKANVAELINPYSLDDKFWAAAVALFTVALLYRGRYGMLQNVSTALVVAFTFITIGNVVALQNTAQWHISVSEFLSGLTFRLPDAIGGKSPIGTALATFGIIGVGATELIAYPYWCLEKGYARFTGPRSEDESWAHRARGWIKVMRYDAFASMVVYTTATLAFFMMGVAVLHNAGLDPDGMRMVSTLAAAYEPVFGAYAGWLFLIGAVAVLYSTFLVANAGNTRMITDGIKVVGLMDRDNPVTHERSLRILSVVLPLLCLAVYCVPGANPVTLVLIGGLMQAILLPMVGFGAMYFRYRKTDKRLVGGKLWDAMLILSFIGVTIAGAWAFYTKISGS